MDFVKPGSQAAEDSFFGLEAALEGLDNGYVHLVLFLHSENDQWHSLLWGLLRTPCS